MQSSRSSRGGSILRHGFLYLDDLGCTRCKRAFARLWVPFDAGIDVRVTCKLGSLQSMVLDHAAYEAKGRHQRNRAGDIEMCVGASGFSVRPQNSCFIVFKRECMAGAMTRIPRVGLSWQTSPAFAVASLRTLRGCHPLSPRQIFAALPIEDMEVASAVLGDEVGRARKPFGLGVDHPLSAI